MKTHTSNQEKNPFVQFMFYSATYNYGHPQGKSKFCWGTNVFDLREDMATRILEINGLESTEVYNLHVVAFNPIVPQGVDYEVRNN